MDIISDIWKSKEVIQTSVLTSFLVLSNPKKNLYIYTHIFGVTIYSYLSWDSRMGVEVGWGVAKLSHLITRGSPVLHYCNLYLSS